MTESSPWSDFIHFLNEEDKKVEVNEITFWVLAGLYGIIALVALVQLIRIHLRVPEYGMTTQKLFHILNCITALSRCIVFSLWFKIITIGGKESHDGMINALANVLLDFPSLLFFTTYTLLVLFWSEIYHQARSLSTAMLRPIFIIVNAFVYIVVVAVWIWMVIVENTSHPKAESPDNEAMKTSINVQALGYQITSVFLATMSVAVVVGFLFYGCKLYYMLKKFPIESKGRKKKLYEVGMVTVTCCIAFSVRAAMTAVSAFVRSARLDVFGHPFYNFLYYSLVEIIPAMLVLWVLRKMPPRRNAVTGNSSGGAPRRRIFGGSNSAPPTDSGYQPIPTPP